MATLSSKVKRCDTFRFGAPCRDIYIHSFIKQTLNLLQEKLILANKAKHPDNSIYEIHEVNSVLGWEEWVKLTFDLSQININI